MPQAYVYPRAMRATRDLMRRRNHLMRKRAELLVHIQNTNSQYNLPAFGVRLAKPHLRGEAVSHFPEAAVRKSVELDVSLIDHYDRELPQLERTSSRARTLTMRWRSRCCGRCRGWARSWGCRSSMRSSASNASRGCRTSCPTAGW